MRNWLETISPKWMHDNTGAYRNRTGTWMPFMDRSYMSDDGYSVSSRLIKTPYGNVEHVTIDYHGDDSKFLSGNGSRDIASAVKMQIKNELFGVDRPAIEILPAKSRLVDVCDVYHLWVFPKRYKFPVSPTKVNEDDFKKYGWSFDLPMLERKIQTRIGEVIQICVKENVPWKDKFDFKNLCYGEERVGVEIFPGRKVKYDTEYTQMFILPEGFQFPFGIHPLKDPMCPNVNRGVIKDITKLAENSHKFNY